MLSCLDARLPRLASLFLLLPLLCLLSQNASAAPLSDAARQADPRLEKGVTFVSDRIVIGDLLEKLSALSGVALTAGERDEAGDDEVSVALHDVKVGDAMNALWSLVSYQKATWDWTATGEGKSASYRLNRPPAARLQAQAQQVSEPGRSPYEWQGKVDAGKSQPTRCNGAAASSNRCR